MIEQQGRVVEVLPQQARIEVGPVEGCDRCANGQGCGAGLFVRLINRKPTRLLLNVAEPLSHGQVVTVGIPENLFLRWVVLLYGLPVIAAFFCAVPTQYLAGQLGWSGGLTDFAVLVASVFGFTVTLLLLKRRAQAGVVETGLSLVQDQVRTAQSGCTSVN